MPDQHLKQGVQDLLEKAIHLKKDGALEAALVLAIAAINRLCKHERVSFESFLSQSVFPGIEFSTQPTDTKSLSSMSGFFALLESVTHASVEVVNEDWLFHAHRRLIGRQTFEYLFSAVKQWCGATDTSGITNKLPSFATDAGVVRLEQSDSPHGPWHR